MDAIREMEEKLRLLGVKPFRGAAFQPLSEDEVEQIEHRLGRGLSASYRHFLRTYGEAGFSENVHFTIPPGDGLFEFGYFYGLGAIMDGVESPPDTMPATMFPIGDEGLGNLYCLGVSGKQAGKVYYWDQNVGGDDEEVEGDVEDVALPPCVRLICNSFEDFIARLVIRD